MHDIFYFTDLHGSYHLYKYMVNWCKRQDPECTIIYGGDACDRGEKGYDIITSLLKDPQIIYLKGNHEDLFTKAARGLYDLIPNEEYSYTQADDILNECMFDDHNLNLHINNGGYITLIDWMYRGMDLNLIEQLEKLPITFSINNIDFSHAGGPPKAFKQVYDAEQTGKKVDIFAEKDMLWDRMHLTMGWFKDKIMVHGHTPVSLLPNKIIGQKDVNRPIIWEGLTAKDVYPGYRLDMDTGAVWTKQAYILNCLTFTIYGFLDNSKMIQEFEPYKLVVK